MKRSLFVRLLVIALLLAIGTSLAAQVVPTLTYEKYTLKNGLEVILSEDHRLPLVAVDVWYHVGPANERPGRTGFAHLFEHMMFQGSRHVQANEHFRDLEASGASDINGTTNFDRTNYFETVPANQVELALWLESDRMGYLVDNLTARNLANQRDVVRNERRQGEAEPYSVVEEAMYHALFPKGHPYYGVVIGSHADIEAAELKDVRDFHELYYKPNNATVAIVGDFNPKTIKAQVEKYFGSIAAGPAVPKPATELPAITSERRLTVTDVIELPRVYMAWHAPRIFQPGDIDAELMARILGGGKSSRLYKKLVYEKQIAQDVSADDDHLMLGSVFTIQATAKPGVKLEELEKAINEELVAWQQQGPTQAELERARNKAERQLIQQLERLGGFGGVADRLNYYNHYVGDPGFLPKHLAGYDSATVASVKKAAQLLAPNARVVVYGVAGKKVLEDIPPREDADLKQPARAPVPDKAEEAWRAHSPKASALPALNLPVPETFKLANGLTVMTIERHNLPVLSARLVVLSGTESNPIDKPGLAGFTAAMLDEGTEKRNALQVADDVDQIGASLDTMSLSDGSVVNARSLSKSADALFELMSDVVLHPSFPAAEVERVRKLRHTALLQEKDSPYTLASKFLALHLYGEKHPYGYLGSGTEAATLATTRDDLMKFYRAGYVPEHAALLIAGDITVAQARQLATKYFGAWTGKGTAPKLPEVTANLKRHTVIVDKPRAGQTVLAIGQIGVARNTPDYVPLEVMNAALGGLFSSRINLNLREAHGYTYGAWSYFSYRRLPGPFVVGGAIRTDVTAPAVTEVFKELDRMRSSMVSDDDWRWPRIPSRVRLRVISRPRSK